MRACQACLSYSLIMRVCFRITLAVVILSIKVIIKHITLHGGALIKAKTASVCYGPKAFLFFDNLDIFDLAFWCVPFFFFMEFCFYLLILTWSISDRCLNPFQTGNTFLSPCQAGLNTYDTINNNIYTCLYLL